MTSEESFLTFRDLKERKKWPFTPEHTRRLVRAGKFPKPFKASGGEGGQNLWRESDVDKYMAERLTQK